MAARAKKGLFDVFRKPKDAGGSIESRPAFQFDPSVFEVCDPGIMNREGYLKPKGTLEYVLGVESANDKWCR